MKKTILFLLGCEIVLLSFFVPGSFVVDNCFCYEDAEYIYMAIGEVYYLYCAPGDLNDILLSGEYVCNQSNHLLDARIPDMSSLFVIGYNESVPSMDVGFKSGNNTFALSESQLPVIDPDSYKTDPSHKHGLSGYTRLGTPVLGVTTRLRQFGSIKTQNAHTGITWDAFGNGEAFNNQPSYRVLYYVIYLGELI